MQSHLPMPARQLLVQHARTLAGTDVARLEQSYVGLVAHLIENVSDEDLDRAISATLSPEVEPLVVLEAADAEWDPDGPAITRLSISDGKAVPVMQEVR